MKNLILAVLSTLLCLPGIASPRETEKREIVIGLPTTLQPESAKTVMVSFNKMIKALPPGSRISVYDAERQQRIAIVEKPVTKSSRKAAAQIREAAQPLLTHLGKKTSVRGGQTDQIRLPSFLSLIESTLTSKASTVRVIIFASPFYAAEGDPAAFGDGLVPGDGFILASSEESAFGTADRDEPLKGLMVDYCYLSEKVFTRGEQEKRAVNRFLGSYLSAIGATLTSFSASADVVVERALAEAKDPSIRTEIDPADTEMVLREVVRPERKVDRAKRTKKVPEPTPKEAEPEPVAVAAPKPKAEPTPIAVESPPEEPRSIDLTIVVDGSISQAVNLNFIEKMIMEILSLCASIPNTTLRVGLVVYREAESTDYFPLTTVKLPTSPFNTGIDVLKDFLTKKVRETSVATFDPDSEVGVVTDKKQTVSRMTALGAHVDFENGIKLGTEMLHGTMKGTVPILVVVGDAVHELGDPETADDVYDRIAARSSLGHVERLAKSQPELRVFSVYAETDRTVKFKTEARSFFKSVAAIGGDHATYLTTMPPVKREVTALLTGRR